MSEHGRVAWSLDECCSSLVDPTSRAAMVVLSINSPPLLDCITVVRDNNVFVLDTATRNTNMVFRLHKPKRQHLSRHWVGHFGTNDQLRSVGSVASSAPLWFDAWLNRNGSIKSSKIFHWPVGKQSALFKQTDALLDRPFFTIDTTLSCAFLPQALRPGANRPSETSSSLTSGRKRTIAEQPEAKTNSKRL